MQLPLTGGCQCGSVRYQITANPFAVYVCHCTECQRQSGSAFALSLAVAREALVVVEGAPAVWRRERGSESRVAPILNSLVGDLQFVSRDSPRRSARTSLGR